MRYINPLLTLTWTFS